MPESATVSALGLPISLDQIILDKVLAVVRPRTKGRAARIACTILSRDAPKKIATWGRLPPQLPLPWDTQSSRRPRKIFSCSIKI